MIANWLNEKNWELQSQISYIPHLKDKYRTYLAKQPYIAAHGIARESVCIEINEEMNLYILSEHGA